MRRIEQALVLVLWALLTVSPSGCVDDERPDDGEIDDTDDGDGGADAGPDASSDSSGVFGTTITMSACEGVSVSFSNFVEGWAGGGTTSGVGGYYQIELPAGVYEGSAYLYAAPYTECDGWVSPVVVSAGLWAEIDIYLYCADVD